MTVDVEDEGRIVGSEKVQLPADGTPASVRVRAIGVGAGSAALQVPRRAAGRRARHAEQRARGARSTCATRSERILYFEGEPRFEMKFLRRAVADDKNLLTSSRCSAPPTTSTCASSGEPDEVVGGFPKTREELFRYRGLILGSVEAGAFSGDQLQMIADFVDRRGGGLLMLGGARSFGEGGYGGTPVADALPLLIDPRTRASDPAPLARLKVAPTRAGQAHAVTQIADDRGRVGGALGRAAAGDQRQRAAADQAGRDGAAQRHRRARPHAASCWRRSSSAAARPSRSRRRTRGSGRCTRRFRSRIRRTRTSGGS